MLVSEYLLTRNRQIDITAGNSQPVTLPQKADENGTAFSEILSKTLAEKSDVEFTGHALKRISSRSIDLTASDKLERLNRGVEIAAEKGSEDALVLVDEAAFIVSVKNNKVITTLSKEDMIGNVFTNIDSTVII